MKINYESWFVRKYLGYGEYSELPRTICALGRRILGHTLLYLLLAIVGSAVVALYLTGLFGYLYVIFSDTTAAEFFDYGSKVATWTGVANIMFWAANAGGGLIGSLIGLRWYKDRRNSKKYHARDEYFKKHGSFPPTPANPIGDFAKGIWARIHDKTCAMLEWDNDPETRRQARREKELAERRAYYDSLHALQAENADNEPSEDNS